MVSTHRSYRKQRRFLWSWLQFHLLLLSVAFSEYIGRGRYGPGNRTASHSSFLPRHSVRVYPCSYPWDHWSGSLVSKQKEHEVPRVDWVRNLNHEEYEALWWSLKEHHWLHNFEVCRDGCTRGLGESNDDDLSHIKKRGHSASLSQRPQKHKRV